MILLIGKKCILRIYNHNHYIFVKKLINIIYRIVISTTCPGTFKRDNVYGSKLEITSPNFPEKYPGISDCTWIMTVSDDYTVIKFTIYNKMN